jgi:hypothetical protein
MPLLPALDDSAPSGWAVHQAITLPKKVWILTMKLWKLALFAQIEKSNLPCTDAVLCYCIPNPGLQFAGETSVNSENQCGSHDSGELAITQP